MGVKADQAPFGDAPKRVVAWPLSESVLADPTWGNRSFTNRDTNPRKVSHAKISKFVHVSLLAPIHMGCDCLVRISAMSAILPVVQAKGWLSAETLPSS